MGIVSPFALRWLSGFPKLDELAIFLAAMGHEPQVTVAVYPDRSLEFHAMVVCSDAVEIRRGLFEIRPAFKGIQNTKPFLLPKGTEKRIIFRKLKPGSTTTFTVHLGLHCKMFARRFKWRKIGHRRFLPTFETPKLNVKLPKLNVTLHSVWDFNN